MNEVVLRAVALIAQERWSLAEGELRQALAQHQDQPRLHSLLAFCLVHTKRYQEAEDEARMAVGLAPDDAYSHYALALVLMRRRKYKPARAAVDESLQLDPHDADSWALKASLIVDSAQWREVLEAAQNGLSVDPEHVECNNLRALALNKLGDRAAAGATLESALQRAPEDPMTHANMGWTLLEQGDRQRALEHFKESLRLDPNSTYARQGIVEAMKSKNFIYRWLLAYFFAMSRLPVKAQLGIVVGFLVVNRGVLWLSNAYPATAPYALAFLLVYLAFALLTWLASPLLDLLLLTDRYGRLVLTDDARQAALLTAGMLILAIMFYAGSWLAGRYIDPKPVHFLEMSALQFALVAVPASMVFRCDAGPPRWKMAAATAGLGLVALIPFIGWIHYTGWPKSPASVTLALLNFNEQYFSYCFLGTQFFAMFLEQSEPER